MIVAVGDEFESYDDFNRNVGELEREANCLFVMDES